MGRGSETRDEDACRDIPRGGRIEKICCSDFGGPYASNGSGTLRRRGSRCGSDLREYQRVCMRQGRDSIRFGGDAIIHVQRGSDGVGDFVQDKVPNLFFVLEDGFVVFCLETVEFIHLVLEEGQSIPE